MTKAGKGRMKDYMFQVSISDTSSTEHEQKEFYNLVVKDKCLTLCDSWTNSVVLEWPYIYIRRYGQSLTTFTIESGRRSESGDGVFKMQTSEAKTIVKRIEEKTKALKKDSSKGRGKQSRSHKELPPVSPMSTCESSAQQKSSYTNHHEDANTVYVFTDNGKVSIGVDKVRVGVDKACIDVDKVRVGVDKICIGVDGVDRDPDSTPPAHQP